MSSDDIMLEYLDLNRNLDDEFRNRKRELILHQYLGKQIDLIVAVEQPALMFLLEELRDLAPGVPVMAINATVPTDCSATGHHFLQRTVNLDFKGTLERALELFPNTRHVVVITGTAEQDLTVKTESGKTAAIWQDKLAFEYTDHLSMDEILERLGNLPPQTIVVYRAINRDKTGKTFVPFDALLEIMKVANMPVFGLYNNYIGTTGAVGGSVYHITQEAERAAHLALAIMNGNMRLTEPVTSLPSEGVPMFDWEQIKRWRGDTSRLPPDSIFVNRSPTLWEQYRATVITAASVFFAMTVLVVTLLIENRNRKTAETSARESEAQHRALAQTAMDGIWWVDMQGRLLQVNSAYCRMSGYEESELLNMSISDLEALETSTDMVEKIRKISTKGYARFETRHRRKDGSTYDIEISAQYLPNNSGKIVTFIRDITERKRAEEALRGSEERYRSLVEDQIELVSRFRADGTFLYVNSGFCLFFGKAKEMVEGSKWHPAAHPDDLSMIKENLSRLCPEHPIVIIENRVFNADGELRWVQFSNRAFFEKNEILLEIQSVGRDITDRKRAEEALIHSERKWRNILVETPQSGISLNPQAKIIFANIHFLKLTGWKEQEVLGQDWFDMFIPEHVREEVRSVFHTTMNPKDTLGYSTYENEVLTRSGELRNIAWSNVLTKDSLGKVVDVTCLGIDMTERLRTEKMLQESEEHHRTILHAAMDGFLVVDMQGRIQEVNESYCRMSGFSADELLTMRISDLEAIEATDDITARIRKIIAHGEDRFESRHRRKDGSIFDVEASLQYRPSDSGRIVSFLCDITERKRAEEALKESEERFRGLVENAPEGIFVQSEGRFQFLNPAMVRLLGCTSPKDLIGTEFMARIAPEYHEAIHNRIRLQREMGMPAPPADQEYLRIDGSRVPVETTAMPIRFQDRDAHLVFVRDSTDRQKAGAERQKLWEQLQQAQKLESIGTLAGGIAHDFNNILFPIVGLSEMLMEDLPAASMNYENAAEINKAGNRARDLVKQILSFSRQAKLEKIPIHVQQILKEVIKLTRATIPSNIEITHFIQSDCGHVLADPTQLHQIAMNLITNAYHALEETGGTISVRLKKTGLSDKELAELSLEAGNYAILSISDNGCGISQEILGKIFEPYFTTKEQGKGTGLGLSVVHGIVKDHGGGIRVISEVGQGTTFNVYLPLLKNAGEVKAADMPVIYERGTERILLVDDEEPIVRLEQMMLEKLGYHVSPLTSSLEALATFKANPHGFDLVITDMNMPKMTGVQLAEKLISIRPDIPIILCTGYNQKITEEKAKSIGIKKFLMKPVDKTEMAKMVRKVLDEGRG